MRHPLLKSLVLALVAASALPSQTTNSIHYPQAGTDGSSGQIVPLGFLGGSPNFDEGRWQQLIQARYLPSTGGVILGLEVLSQATLSATYPSLQITMSMVAPGGSLSSTFATNLPQPVPVFSHQAYTVNWVSQQWQSFPLDIPFFYDGVSDVVVEIQKVVSNPASGLAHHQTDGDPGRGLPIARYTFGAVGSGASTSPTANYATVPLKMGFQFLDAPTMNLTGLRGGANSRVFPIGGSFDATLQGQPFGVFGSLLSFGWATSPIAVPGIGGVVYLDLSSTLAYASGTLDPSGTSTTSWSIPNNVALVGVGLVFQGISINPGIGLVTTNATDLVINT